MKFLQNWSFRKQAVVVACTTLVLLLAQIFLIDIEFNTLEDTRTQVDFTRSAQLQAQKIELQFSRLQQNPALASTVIAEIKRQDYLLDLIEHGGRFPDKNLDVIPLQKLPGITFQKLKKHFETYRTQVQQVIDATAKGETAPQATLYSKSEWLLVSEWYTKLIQDLYDEVSVARNNFFVTIIISGVIDLGIIVLVVYGFFSMLIKPIERMEQNTARHQHTTGLMNNELGALANQINDVIEQFRDASDFVKSIGDGKLDIDYKNELDNNYVPGKNQLADSLILMQRQLRTLQEEEGRRQWANEGLAQFVDILRTSADNLNKLGDKIISTLVQYTGANQGGLYVVHDDDRGNKYLDLIALYAFNSKKFESQKVKPGEGLLGQAYLERATTYLTEIPEEYIRITSGLGDANPRSILIVPLKVDQDIYGLVELASFREFKPHEIAFVEKLGETIASTLASVKAAENNRKLLDESRIATESMRSQEEEMRQNMEELTATQEEMQRILKEAQQRETYLSNLMDSTNDAYIAVDRTYHVALRNNAPWFLDFLKIGVRFEPGFDVLSLFKAEEVAYHKGLYDRVFNGETVKVNKSYFDKPYEITYSPLRSASGDIIGASVFAHDVSTIHQLQERITALEQQLQQAPQQTPLAELESMHQTLQVNLEALAIAADEMERKRRS